MVESTDNDQSTAPTASAFAVSAASTRSQVPSPDILRHPNPAALLRLAGAVLVEQHDEWDAGERRYFSEASMHALETINQLGTDHDKEVVAIPELSAA
jgi:hypothetical protein